MKLGIFGGTFNPIHCGHIINAEILRSDFSLDRILFIPAKTPVHKKPDSKTLAEDRVNMVELAINNSSGMEVSTIEIDKDTPSYTIFTIKELLKKYSPSELFLIIGSDSFNEIDTWKDYRELLKLVTILVMIRPGDSRCREDLFDITKKNYYSEKSPD